jgi:DNA-binding CsgD family transcriptional regulator
MTTGLVGRDRAHAAVRACLTEARSGPRALILEGAAGIGKTTVWRAALDEARGEGTTVLQTVAEPAEARMSFVGLADLLSDHGTSVALPGHQRDALDQALLRTGPDDPRPPDARTIGTALLSVLVALATQRPVLVAVDDVQWLDAATVAALAFAARRLDDHPVGLLVTARTPPARTDRLGLRRALGDERCVSTRLGPLATPALQEILESRLGWSYPAPVLRRITEVCDGNPLFALEIGRALGPVPALVPGRPLPVPEEIHELVAGRVGDLSPAGRAALSAAAALSHPTVELIERASSPAGLDAAESAGLLRVEAGRVVLAHPLYASAIDAELTSGRRRALHRGLAALVPDSEERAHHLALGTAGADAPVAAELDAAAALARARGAWSSAGELFEQARRLTPAADGEAADRRAVRAAEHHIHAGDRPRARRLLEEVLADESGGTLRGEALRLLADVSYNENSLAEAGRLLEAALAETEDPALAVSLELGIAYVRCHHLGDFAGALPYAQDGLATARELGDRALEADALAVLAMVAYLNGYGVDWAAVERACALEDPRRVAALDRRPPWIAALLKVFVGRLDEGRAELLALEADAERSGDESDVAEVLFWLCWVEAHRGDLPAAVAFGEQALLRAGLAASEQSRAWAFSHLACAHAQRGDVGATRSAVASSVEICLAIGNRLPLLWDAAATTELELSLGDPAAAWAAVAELTAPVEQEGVGEPFLVFLPGAIEALIGLGELDRAQRLLDDFEDRARVLDRAWARFRAGRCRGLLAAERGDLDAARAALEAALVQHARQEMPFERARTLLVLGQVRRRARARRLAREALEQALGLFEATGSEIWARRTREELDRIAPRRRAGELTEAERRVAELAATGLSNKEIAGTLFVSVHTVEVHLSHAYATLGVRSRAQLAGRLSAPAQLAPPHEV